VTSARPILASWQAGHDQRGDNQDGLEQPMARWLREALTAVGAVSLRHRGLHRYLFPLGDRRQRAQIKLGYSARPYPKGCDAPP
jgi:hypothetical protein